MQIIYDYIRCIRDIRRYSDRTVQIYEESLLMFVSIVHHDEAVSDKVLLDSLNVSELRSYMVTLMEDRGMSPRTVRLHMSALSSFCTYLVKKDIMKSNPVRQLTKPKVGKRLPEYYRQEAMAEYFGRVDEEYSVKELDAFISLIDRKDGMECDADADDSLKRIYEQRLSRLIISFLYATGVRRSELIKLNLGDVDFGRKVAKVSGKGNKMREIPLLDSLCEEILLYLKAVGALFRKERSLKEPLFVTYSGIRLYPVYVDRVVKKELGGVKGITGRKSPHVLRHSLATDLMNSETGLNSIKELLGHASLATTQVYTHTSIARLKDIYKQAHPRAKNGGKNGD